MYFKETLNSETRINFLTKLKNVYLSNLHNPNLEKITKRTFVSNVYNINKIYACENDMLKFSLCLSYYKSKIIQLKIQKYLYVEISDLKPIIRKKQI